MVSPLAAPKYEDSKVHSTTAALGSLMRDGAFRVFQVFYKGSEYCSKSKRGLTPMI